MGRGAAPRLAARRGGGADWALHATNAEILEALARRRHGDSLREYFGARALEELAALAAAAKQAKRRAEPRVLIVPGMMGSRLCDAARRGAAPPVARPRLLWVDPLRIGAGHLTQLALPSTRAIRPRGVLLFSYLRLTLSSRSRASMRDSLPTIGGSASMYSGRPSRPPSPPRANRLS